MHMILSSILYVIAIQSLGSDGQSCINLVNVQQQGSIKLNVNSQVISYGSGFRCYGRLTGYLVSLYHDNIGDNYPHIEIWRPTFISDGGTEKAAFMRISEYVLTEDDIIEMDNYYFANVSFAINETTQLRPVDIIGYYQPPSPRYTVWSINTTGYLSGNISTGKTSQGVVFSVDHLNYFNNSQPLIQALYDVQCDDLSTPTNGEMMSCSSGRVGVGYEGDTCSFTCNTGHKLTGSDTRTCQSNGSWSGTDVVCRRVSCLSLSYPKNGIISCPPRDDGVPSYGDTCSFTCNTGYELTASDTRTCQNDGSWSGSDDVCRRVPCPNLTQPDGRLTGCSLGDDGVSSYEDTCNFTCNTGYELTGSETRTCQSDGSWSGSEDVCRRVSCPSLTNPNNGMINCSLGDDGVPSYEDTCSFTCNTGYELTGSSERTCQSDGSWSGSPVSCIIMECPLSSLPMNSMLPESCNSTYQSMCELQCKEGFNGTGDPSYVCDVLSDGSSVMWMAEGDTWRCKRVQCPAPVNGTLWCPNETTVGVFEDTCTFSCNAGYELQGSNNGTCLADQSWSGGDPICVALNCSTSSPLNNSQLQSSCDTQYQSTCTTVCVDGYTGVGGSYTCVVTDEDTNSVGWNGSTSCQRVPCPHLNNPDNGMINCSLGDDGVPSYEDTCSFTCNTGYELTGSYTRTCQSNGSWSGNQTMCKRITCEDLETPSNGIINCSNNQPLQYQDSCTFQCNDGYELQSSVIRQCEASGEWSGNETQCDIRHCPDITTLVPNSRSCDTSYNTTCMVECEDGYNRSGDFSQYSCDLNDTEVVWMFTGSGVTCSPVPCVSLSDPGNGNVTCPSNTSVFQDICTYYCNRGYQLEGNRQTRCNADGTWSREPVTCTILKCNDPEVEIANSQSVGVCNVTYGSICSLNCPSGFSVSGNGEHACDDVNDEGTSVKWRSVGGAFSCVAAEASTDSSSGGGSTIAIIAGSVGGAIFFIIILLLCIVILCVKQSQKRRSHSFDNKMVIELNPDVKISDNPSYNIITQNKKQEDQYDYVVHNKFSLQDNTQDLDTIKMDSNPSYGRIQGCSMVGTGPVYDVNLQTNPSYNSLKESTHISEEVEDENGYVETNSQSMHGAGYLKVVTSTAAAKEREFVYHVATDDNTINHNSNPVSGDIKQNPTSQ